MEKEKIEKLLRAGMQAPSAANQQPWEFIVVENKETFSLPENLRPFTLISIGYPDNQKNEFVDKYNEKKVHYGNWK